MLSRIKYNLFHILSFFWVLIIYIQIYFLHLNKNKRYFYFNFFGWGDNIVFFLNNYIKIKFNPNYYCLAYSKERSTICDFFFKKEKIFQTYFAIPFFFSASKFDYILTKLPKFMPTLDRKFEKLNEEYFINNKDSMKNLLKIKYKKESKIDCSKFGSYVCLYLRFSEKSQIFPSIRQSQNINKIFDLIDFFLKKNFNVMLVGKQKEKYLKKVIYKYPKLIDKRIFLMHKEISKKSILADQINIFDNSLFYCGTHAGPLVIYYFLKKKAISFDAFYRKEWDDIKFKNFKFIYKKINIRNNWINLDETNLKMAQNNKAIQVKECSFEIIVDAIQDNLN